MVIPSTWLPVTATFDMSTSLNCESVSVTWRSRNRSRLF